MGKIWVTSDTHFGSERTMELSKRPFESVEDMDNKMIENWNSVVDDDDLIIHLGDFGNYDVVNRLKGKIILICGNYEKGDISKKHESYKNFKEHLQNNGFHSVCFNKFIIKRKNRNNIVCVHEPSKRNEVCFNLFGHIHKLQMVKYNGLNVGTDCHNFYPIDMNTVEFYKNAIENFYDEEVFEK